MKAISIMWTEGVEDLEARSALIAVQKVVETMLHASQEKRLFLPGPDIYPFGTWIVPSIPRGQPYWGTQWYVDNSYDEGTQQIIAPKFLELVQAEPWQQADPHYDLAIVEQDLALEERLKGFISTLGLVMPGVATIVSVYQLRAVEDLSLRLLSLQRLVSHCLGHLFQVPSPWREEDVEFSFGEKHCKGICVMRHTPDLKKLVEQAVAEAQGGVLFCDACRKDLLTLLVGSHFGFS